MPEPKAQLVDPQGPIDVPGLSVTGVTTATGGFVGAVQGSATGLASTTTNLSVGIITATKFQGNTTGNVSGLADGTNINVGIITSTSFTGDLVGNAAGLSTTTANIKAGILSATSFAGNFTGVASGITGTPNIVVGIMTGTLKGDGSTLTGIAATNWITNNVTANSGTTAIDLSDGNVVKFTQTSNTTVSFANTGTSNIVSFIRPGANYTLTWPSAIKWDGGSAPTLNTTSGESDVVTLLTRDEGVTWYGWESVNRTFSDEQYSLYIWGRSRRGEGGLNKSTDAGDVGANISSPTQLPGYWTSQFSGSYYSSFALKSDDTLWGWGQNSVGQLGQNSVVKYSSPVQIPGYWNGSTVPVYGSKGSFMAMRKSDGTLWAWGNNTDGNLGLNDANRRSSPTQIPGTTWSTFDVGANSMLATKTDGTLWSWGYNNLGSLGVNNRTEYSSPIQIPGTTWSKVSAYKTGGGAIKTDGTLWVWGRNHLGQLGQDNTTHYSSPVQIPGTTWSEYSSSPEGNFGIKTDGTLWAWGNNENEQLGQGNSTDYSSPREISGSGTTWKKVYAGGTGANPRAIKTDGTLWTWGVNTYGTGGGPTSQQSSPISQIPGSYDFFWHGGNSVSMAAKD